jgi:uncharacterized membrane protein YdcZ (DUF606 family)
MFWYLAQTLLWSLCGGVLGGAAVIVSAQLGKDDRE